MPTEQKGIVTFMNIRVHSFLTTEIKMLLNKFPCFIPFNVSTNINHNLEGLCLSITNKAKILLEYK